MKKDNMLIWGLVLLSAVMMSVPFLLPHTGVRSLIGLVPLLCMERIATMTGRKHVWIYHYATFVLWNAFTTFWVCNATVGGGLFAIFANAFQMSLIFGLFRFSRRRFSGSLPYIFLMVTWIAWEHFYFDAEISWPWLVLGNSFARTTWAVQWYEYTGALGGSLWVWMCNLGIFGLLVSLSDGRWGGWNIKAKSAAVAALAIILISPFIISSSVGSRYEDAMNAEESLDVLIVQPNIDPYNKFQAMTQDQQNAILESQIRKSLAYRKADSCAGPLLVVAPETFTNDIMVGKYEKSRTWTTNTTTTQTLTNFSIRTMNEKKKQEKTNMMLNLILIGGGIILAGVVIWTIIKAIS